MKREEISHFDEVLQYPPVTTGIIAVLFAGMYGFVSLVNPQAKSSRNIEMGREAHLVTLPTGQDS